MIKFLSENWALLSFVISAIAYIYYQVIAMRKGIRALLRADLIRLYNKYHDDYGYCPLYVKQSLEDEYKQYHTLKGNGVGTQIYHTFLPNHHMYLLHLQSLLLLLYVYFPNR